MEDVWLFCSTVALGPSEVGDRTTAVAPPAQMLNSAGAGDVNNYIIASLDYEPRVSVIWGSLPQFPDNSKVEDSQRERERLLVTRHLAAFRTRSRLHVQMYRVRIGGKSALASTAYQYVVSFPSSRSSPLGPSTASSSCLVALHIDAFRVDPHNSLSLYLNFPLLFYHHEVLFPAISPFPSPRVGSCLLFGSGSEKVQGPGQVLIPHAYG